MRILILGLIFVTSASYAEGVESWLDKMSQAMNTTNFEGTLIIRQQDQLQALKVRHGMNDDGLWERLESLTGEAREIIRHNSKVTTIFPQRNLVTVSRESAPMSLHSRLPSDMDVLKKLYTVKATGFDRVAGRHTRVLELVPLDKFRYGYKFWLEKDSGLLLKCDLLDEQKQVVEQLMFSDLKILKQLPDNIDRISSDISSYKMVDLDMGKVNHNKSTWMASHLPQGFTMTSNNIRPSVKGIRHHIMYSDGMASVSVFIEKHHPYETTLMGVSRMGALNVYSFHRDENHVTVIGEVPVATVRLIGQSIREQKP
ncbi:MAG: MucB/RseB C-terminal domain-containing protein [Gammaproteobacteria bacterium]